MEQWELEGKREEFVRDFYYKKLNFCKGGCPSSVLDIIKNVLKVIANREKQCDSTYWNELRNTLNLKIDYDTFINDGMFLMILNILNNCGVLLHDSGIGGSKITDYGRELLENLIYFTDENLDFMLLE